MGTLNEKLAYLDETKKQIKEKLIEKNTSINDTNSFRDYVEKIDEINKTVFYTESIQVSIKAKGNGIMSILCETDIKQVNLNEDNFSEIIFNHSQIKKRKYIL